MKYLYLNDRVFLEKLDNLHLRTSYAKIYLLDFPTERVIKEIQGEISAGTLTINGSSAIRRTLSLTMFAKAENNDLENIDNEISIKRKVRVEVGFKNPFSEYKSYGDIIWFPCGVYILSSASLRQGISGWTISISGKDKMCLLDGSVGGTIPAPTIFHEKIIERADGSSEVLYPTIFQIIFEAVNHFGGEDSTKIIISDVPDKVKQLIKYSGADPIYFNSNYSSFSYQADTFDNPNMKKLGDNVGYRMTSFTYPGELVLGAGETVVALLNKIVEVLGNFEYFYDLDGNFIFQEIKNYKNTNSPLTILDGKEQYYLKTYDNKAYTYSLTNLDTTTEIAKTPKYDNIKNDFIVWGERELSSGAKVAIHYRLAIDEKPLPDLAMKYMQGVYDSEGQIISYRFTNINPWEIIQPINWVGQYGDLMTFSTNIDTYIELEYQWQYRLQNGTWYNTSLSGRNYSISFTSARRNYIYRCKITNPQSGEVVYTKPVKGYLPTDQNIEVECSEYTYSNTLTPNDSPLFPPCGEYEWREELYRRALNAQVTNSVYDNAYDAELIAWWRTMYDPSKGYAGGVWSGEAEWPNGWAPAVTKDPSSLVFWLDFIDTGSELGNYSVKQIGRRTKVINKNDITSIYNKEVEDVVFLENKAGDQEFIDLINYYNSIGQNFFALQPAEEALFTASSTGASCFDEIRDMLYQYLCYNTQIQITCLPKYYLEVNNIIYINDKISNIQGNYQITQITLPLAYNGTMQVQAIEVWNRD